MYIYIYDGPAIVWCGRGRERGEGCVRVKCLLHPPHTTGAQQKTVCRRPKDFCETTFHQRCPSHHPCISFYVASFPTRFLFKRIFYEIHKTQSVECRRVFVIRNESWQYILTIHGKLLQFVIYSLLKKLFILIYTFFTLLPSFSKKSMGIQKLKKIRTYSILLPASQLLNFWSKLILFNSI